MEKLLKALKYVKGKIADLEDDLQHYTMVDKDKCKEFYIREDLRQFNNILESLQELQLIKEAKPSKALKCLDTIAKKVELADNDDYWEVRNAYQTVEQALLKAQEQEKEEVKE